MSKYRKLTITIDGANRRATATSIFDVIVSTLSDTLKLCCEVVRINELFFFREHAIFLAYVFISLFIPLLTQLCLQPVSECDSGDL